MKKEICLFCANQIEVAKYKETNYPTYIECQNCGNSWDYRKIHTIDKLLKDVFNRPLMRNIVAEESYRQKYLNFYEELGSWPIPIDLTKVKELKQKKVRTRISRVRTRLSKNKYTDELGFGSKLAALIIAILIVLAGVWIHTNSPLDFGWFGTIIVFILKWTIAFPLFLAILISIPSLFASLFTSSLSAQQQKKRDLKRKKRDLQKIDDGMNEFTQHLLEEYPSLRILVFTTKGGSKKKDELPSKGLKRDKW